MTTMRLRWYQFSTMDLVFVALMILVVTWSAKICIPAIENIFFNGQNPVELMSHGK